MQHKTRPTPQEMSNAASVMGRAGGVAAMRKMTPEQRRILAKKAANTLWARRRAAQEAKENRNDD